MARVPGKAGNQNHWRNLKNHAKNAGLLPDAGNNAVEHHINRHNSADDIVEVAGRIFDIIPAHASLRTAHNMLEPWQSQCARAENYNDCISATLSTTGTTAAATTTTAGASTDGNTYEMRFYSGVSAVFAGDTNNDSIDDLLFVNFTEHKIYIVYGKASFSDFALTTATEGINGDYITISFPNNDLSFGTGQNLVVDDFSFSTKKDIIVGASGGSRNIYVFYGDDLDGSTNTNSADVTIQHQTLDFGYAMASGNISGGTYKDFIATVTGQYAYIFYGDDLGSIVNEENAKITITIGDGGAQSSVVIADINGSGNEDVVLASFTGGNNDKVYVFVDLSDGDLTQDNATATITGENLNGKFGYALAVSSNASGTNYLAIGEYDANLKGAVYLFDTSNLTGEINFDAADVTINGLQNSASFGVSISFADIDNDGKEELIVGASNYGVDGSTDVGRVYIFDGNDLASASDADDASTSITHSDVQARFGFTIATGRFNSGSYDDIASCHVTSGQVSYACDVITGDASLESAITLAGSESLTTVSTSTSAVG